MNVEFPNFLAVYPQQYGLTEQEYQSWVQDMPKKTVAMVQQFHIHPDTNYGIQVECWTYEKLVINGDLCQSEGSEKRPFNRNAGWVCWWQSQAPWGDVFPARILPHNPDLLGQNNRAFGDRPVYEPLYQSKKRVEFLVEHQPKFPGKLSKAKQRFPYSYSRCVGEGELLIVFNDDPVDYKEVADSLGIQFLYSKELDGMKYSS